MNSNLQGLKNQEQHFFYKESSDFHNPFGFWQ